VSVEANDGDASLRGLTLHEPVRDGRPSSNQLLVYSVARPIKGGGMSLTSDNAAVRLGQVSYAIDVWRIERSSDPGQGGTQLDVTSPITPRPLQGSMARCSHSTSKTAEHSGDS
jgi:hypothetical protein